MNEPNKFFHMVLIHLSMSASALYNEINVFPVPAVPYATICLSSRI